MPILDTEKQDKKMFVTSELAAMIAEATHGLVARLDYKVEGGDEIVYVTTSNGKWMQGAFAVNVSCDSLWAIAKDVMKAVGERYE